MTIFTPIQSFNKAWSKRYYDTGITGKVDFYVGHGNTTYLWAEEKRGVTVLQNHKTQRKSCTIRQLLLFLHHDT